MLAAVGQRTRKQVYVYQRTSEQLANAPLNGGGGDLCRQRAQQAAHALLIHALRLRRRGLDLANDVLNARANLY